MHYWGQTKASGGGRAPTIWAKIWPTRELVAFMSDDVILYNVLTSSGFILISTQIQHWMILIHQYVWGRWGEHQSGFKPLTETSVTWHDDIITVLWGSPESLLLIICSVCLERRKKLNLSVNLCLFIGQHRFSNCSWTSRVCSHTDNMFSQ